MTDLPMDHWNNNKYYHGKDSTKFTGEFSGTCGNGDKPVSKNNSSEIIKTIRVSIDGIPVYSDYDIAILNKNSKKLNRDTNKTATKLISIRRSIFKYLGWESLSTIRFDTNSYVIIKGLYVTSAIRMIESISEELINEFKIHVTENGLGIFSNEEIESSMKWYASLIASHYVDIDMSKIDASYVPSINNIESIIETYCSRNIRLQIPSEYMVKYMKTMIEPTLQYYGGLLMKLTINQ